MKKEVYMTPEMEITHFDAEDVIVTSFDQEVGEVLNIFDLDL